MKISEAASAAGLDVSSVRFYERKGLINPNRGEDSNYRDYTAEDIETLKRIVLFRKIDMSIEDIKNVLLEKPDLEEVLELQMDKLQQDKQKIESSIWLCRKMMDEGYTDEDTNKYISCVYDAENQGRKFPDVMPVLDQISQNSGFEKVVGYPIYLRIMGNSVARRLLAVVIFLILVAFPMTELVVLVYQFLHGGENFFRVIIWIAYTFITASIFIKMMGITTKT